MKRNPNGGGSGRDSREFDVYDAESLETVSTGRGKYDHQYGAAKKICENDGVYSPDGKHLLLYSQNVMRKRSADTHHLISDATEKGGAKAFKLSSSGDTLMAMVDDQKVVVYDPVTMAPKAALPTHLRIDDSVLIDHRHPSTGKVTTSLITLHGQENCLQKSSTQPVAPREQESLRLKGAPPINIISSGGGFEGCASQGDYFGKGSVLLSSLHFGVAGFINEQHSQMNCEMFTTTNGKVIHHYFNKKEGKVLKLKVSSADDSVSWTQLSKRDENFKEDITISNFEFGDRSTFFTNASEHHGHAAVIGYGNGALIIDTSKNTLLAEVNVSLVPNIAFSPNGKWLAFSEARSTSLFLVSLPPTLEPSIFDTSKAVAILQPKHRPSHTGRNHTLRFSDDSMTLMQGVAASWTNTTGDDAGWAASIPPAKVRLEHPCWSSGEFYLLNKFALSHDASILAAVGSSDDSLVTFCVRCTAASEDNNASGGVFYKEVKTVSVDTKRISSIGFDSTTNLFFTMSEDTIVRWWEVTPGSFVPRKPATVPSFATKFFKASTVVAERNPPPTPLLANDSTIIKLRLIAQIGPKTPGFVCKNARGADTIVGNGGVRMAIETA